MRSADATVLGVLGLLEQNDTLDAFKLLGHALPRASLEEGSEVPRRLAE